MIYLILFLETRRRTHAQATQRSSARLTWERDIDSLQECAHSQLLPALAGDPRFPACPNGTGAEPPGSALSTPAYQKLVSGKEGYLSISATKGSEVSTAEKGAMTLPA